MNKIREQFSKLQSDLRYKRNTKRVKLFFAGISCVILLVIIAVAYSLSGASEQSGLAAGNYAESQDKEHVSESGTVSEDPANEDVSENAAELENSSTEETVDDGGAMLAETADAGEAYIDDTLFIGDSNTVRMMNYGITSEKNTLAVVGMGIQSVKTLQCIQFTDRNDPVTMIEAVKLMQPRRIIITFGTNNATGMDTSDFIKKYEESLDAIHDAYPYADILINAIPPICEKNSYPKLSQKSIDDFNSELVNLAEKLGYKFIDTASVMKDASSGYAKSGYTVNDGIHLSDSGFAAMFTYIRTHSHIVDDNRPKPLAAAPTQIKATYVIDGSGKMKNDPSAYKEMSEVSEAQKEALKAAQEEALKAASTLYSSSSSTAKCTHTSVNEMIIREATESQTGTKRYTCNNCGYIYDETIPRKQSSSSASSSSSTAKATTTTTTTSSSATQPPHTHTWDAGTVTTQATESAPGVLTKKCTGCDATTTETIAQLPPSQTSSSTELEQQPEQKPEQTETPKPETTPEPPKDPEPEPDPAPEPETQEVEE